ncbi:MAG: class I SAM-dependent methyltransferase [Anaerolineae bacterium]
MNLIDIVNRTPIPEPWAEGEKIPWNEPAFSMRMLHEHLSQDHDLASRRFATIDAHVAWIRRHILCGEPARVLDLGCGPGFYAQRLARMGHTCIGVDFSPASIAYAKAQAEGTGLPLTYIEGDVRTIDYGSGYDLVMFIYGEFNVFRPTDARGILQKAYQTLKPGGWLLLEPHTFAAVESLGKVANSWYTTGSGLFSERAHFCLTENSWDAEGAVATERHFIIDALTGDVTRYASSMQAYTDEQYRALLTTCGYHDVRFYPSLKGEVDESTNWLCAIVAQKPVD